MYKILRKSLITGKESMDYRKFDNPHDAQKCVDIMNTRHKGEFTHSVVPPRARNYVPSMFSGGFAKPEISYTGIFPFVK